ncbi:spore coat protein [Candidatus Kaiserbacteria bacterium CG10_big_fil_rev_8_21_14_0_10_47_16]|uniref:glucose-1-phosphate thymidylyltransferase n=1 Tax=Candidatus Kaiserbacteria bacterium CG10_big_fil_rev_8_21_14_0_10_47_16 TaxID=1974608 RepID=A0A2H0UEU5_9BACT|nr:MAG: spore coat protein [Candidatus Kaiserbacteria bacterium CG10_big_fil_rev_8_21_14_0_10_47_16]
MKGIILAGGVGTRLRPLTRITNKHLLPVYDRPMIMYPLDTLKRSGITEIMIVTGREYAGDFMNFLGSGREYGVELSYAIQDIDNGGIADALKTAEDFSAGQSVAVILGDNIFTQDFTRDVKSFSGGAKVFFKKVENPNRFGVPVFDAKNKHIVRIEEKPKKPKSSLAQTGFYLYDSEIFSIIQDLKPSARGELEITDANNIYLKKGKLSHGLVKGLWSDAGTIESLHKVSVALAKRAL